MTSINDSTLMPVALRDTRRMNQFVSIAAAVAGLLFGLDIGVIAGALPRKTTLVTLLPAACCSSRAQSWFEPPRPLWPRFSSSPLCRICWI